MLAVGLLVSQKQSLYVNYWTVLVHFPNVHSALSEEWAKY